MPLAASDVTPSSATACRGVIEGKHYRIGSARWLELAQEENAAQGLTIYLADEHGLLARFILADTLRPDAGALIQAFKGGRPANHHSHRRRFGPGGHAGP